MITHYRVPGWLEQLGGTHHDEIRKGEKGSRPRMESGDAGAETRTSNRIGEGDEGFGRAPEGRRNRSRVSWHRQQRWEEKAELGCGERSHPLLYSPPIAEIDDYYTLFRLKEFIST
ncbi:hypothetical protein B296_00040851 [Ensete ventricosum]|uniref:Uncharacterized protein n=1 Tax=Ensete ventricosum TaxID=4639 RepID=A0A426XMH3_ENSVE|nr:hypothetical protein B296_00040851 [Ensete ventricosum]